MKTGALLARGMRRLREQRGWTQAQLAEAVGRHEQFISQLERQERAPGIETIDALAKAFGLAPWELLKAGAGRAPTQSKRDALALRVRAVVEAWPEADHQRLVRVLVELGRLASSARTRSAPKTSSKREAVS
ncbi:MAG: helix-turn-helix domain-containing protein [Sandaracinaceae bacterium]|nr:helix-turn-helix domain-containing protein [Sandaracinaceae bacterium]